MEIEVVESRARLLELARSNKGYVYNDTDYCLHLPRCGMVKKMKPEPAMPHYDFVRGDPYPAGRNRGVTVFLHGTFDEVKTELDRRRPGVWTCGRPECFGTTR
jgi:hypothetical protein